MNATRPSGAGEARIEIVFCSPSPTFRRVAIDCKPLQRGLGIANHEQRHAFGGHGEVVAGRQRTSLEPAVLV